MILINRGWPLENEKISWLASELKISVLDPATLSRCLMYSCVSSSVKGSSVKCTVSRCRNALFFSSFIMSMTSFCPTKNTFINLVYDLSMFDKRRICSMSSWFNLWASSIISNTCFFPEYVVCKKCSNWIRKSALVFESNSILNCLVTNWKKSWILRSGSGIAAIIASISLSIRK